MKCVTLFCVAMLLVTGGSAAEKKAASKAPRPAFAKVEDKPGLPRVLLIGDSISIGYTLPVRELLQDKANVHRIPANGGPTTSGLAHLKAWLGDSKWDVIHFNWGLHDLKYLGPKGENRANPKSPTSHQQVPVAQYEKNLAELVKQLQATGASLIWCNTTPTPDSEGRVAGDEKKYNEAAARVMQAAHILTDDLCGHAQARLKEIQLPVNVHFTPEGYRYLAQKVAASISGQLPAK